MNQRPGQVRVFATAVVPLALALEGGAGCNTASRDVRTGVIAQSEFITVVATGADGDRTLRLDAAPGARINALLPPVLTLDGGAQFSFASDSLTADSSYYALSPTTVLGTALAQRATLNASVCPAGLRVCLSVELPVTLR